MGLVCGISFLCATMDMKRGGVLKYYLNLFLVAVLEIAFVFLKVELWQGFVMIGFAILFFVCNYIDSKTLNKKGGISKKEEKKLKPLWLTILLFVLGAGAIGGGAYLLVDKVEYLSKVIGIGEEFVGLTIIAIGTSLPELITVISAIKDDSPYLAIGNIVGSNILNLTLILGAARISAWQNNMFLSKETAYISMPLVILFTLILTLPILIKKKTYKWQGITFLCIYALYIVYLILNLVYKFI